MFENFKKGFNNMTKNFTDKEKFSNFDPSGNQRLHNEIV